MGSCMHLWPLWALLLTSMVQTSVTPTGFLLVCIGQTCTNLVQWTNHQLDSTSSTTVTVTSMEDCLTNCLSYIDCLSFDILRRADVSCNIHRSNSNPEACSSAQTQLQLLEESTAVPRGPILTVTHYKIRNNCYAEYGSLSGTIVTDRQGLTLASIASSIDECNIMCQIADDCSVAEYNTLDNSCFLFPRLDSAPTACRTYGSAVGYFVAPQACYQTPGYTNLTAGYFGTDFLTATTLYTYHKLVSNCRQQCDAEMGCTGYAFDFSFELRVCRLYKTQSVCNADELVEQNANNWFSYTKKDACVQGIILPTSSVETPPVTQPSQQRSTTAPILTFADYARTLGVQVRGGRLQTISQSVTLCRLGCDQVSSCKAFEYDRDESICYYHDTSSVCLTPIQSPDTVHYRKLTSTCTWTYTGQKVIGGKPVPSAVTIHSCEWACRFKYACTGFDFNSRYMQCFVHGNANVCTRKQDAVDVVHYRLRTHICPDESRAILYENSKLEGGVSHGVIPSALQCFLRCTQETGCTGVDYNKASRLCWLQGINKGCKTPLTDTCCDHLRVQNACAWSPDLAPPRQAFVDVLTTRSWNIQFASMECNDDINIKTICAVTQAISKGGSVATLTYIGALPLSGKLVIRFETMSAGKAQDAVLNSSFNDALNALKPRMGRITFKDLPPRLQVLEMFPRVGPLAGGTLVLLIGFNLNFVTSVSLGHIACYPTVMTSALIGCTTPQLLDNSFLNLQLRVSVQPGENIPELTAFNFTYKGNPVIFSVQPLETILSGGVYLTVTGSNLDVVGLPIMKTTVLHRPTSRTQIYQTICVVQSSELMRCPTPRLPRGMITKRRRRNTINRLDEKEFTITFKLDAVIIEYSPITVFEDPYMKAFSGNERTLTFVSTWPLEDKTIEIKGARLRDGLQSDDFEVEIGESHCANIQLYLNRIVCEPPAKRPYVKPEDQISGNRIPVMVKVGHLQFDTGYLEYQQNLWEYPPGKWGIIGVGSGIIALILIIIVICCCCYHARFDAQSDMEYSHSGHREVHLNEAYDSRDSSHPQDYRDNSRRHHQRRSRQGRQRISSRGSRDSPPRYKMQQHSNNSQRHERSLDQHHQNSNRKKRRNLDYSDEDFEEVYRG